MNATSIFDRWIRPAAAALAMVVCAAAAVAQTGGAASSPSPVSESKPGAPSEVVLDEVVAVVNNHAILESDVEREMRLVVLEPEQVGRETREDALERLISRTLIQQQIREEEAQASEPSKAEVQDRLTELRKELPACVHAKCETDAGWAAFLHAYDLTEAQVENYLRLRMELLGFIEERFRQGIRISQEEIEDYYRNTLLPQYRSGETPPALDTVSKRIEEVLLQQQVNVLFGSWLDNLRKQGDVEILDPALEPKDPPKDAPKQAQSSAGGGLP